jgi:hypothetical protein
MRSENERADRKKEIRGPGLPYILLCNNLFESLQDLRVAELCESEDRASALNGLDDLCGDVAGKRKASGTGVEFHKTTKSLLSCFCHTRERRGDRLSQI